MTQIDEYESLFKSAAKPIFHMEPVSIRKVAMVFDDAVNPGHSFEQCATTFVNVWSGVEREIEIDLIRNDDYQGVSSLLDRLKSIGPDLIVTYRNLRIPATEFPYSLGVFVDVMTQATSIPVLLLPRPEQQVGPSSTEPFDPPSKVIAVTDHLAGDAHLVTLAARCTAENGTLVLAHIEDQQTFERYIETISKIPEIDTAIARETILDQLLKEPRDYIDSCVAGIREAGLPMTVESAISLGHQLSDYRNLIREHHANLVVLNTKDHDQLAMHGLAYPLSVELRELPLLLI